jgi:hypothetical protein
VDVNSSPAGVKLPLGRDNPESLEADEQLEIKKREQASIHAAELAALEAAHQKRLSSLKAALEKSEAELLEADQQARLQLIELRQRHRDQMARLESQFRTELQKACEALTKENAVVIERLKKQLEHSMEARLADVQVHAGERQARSPASTGAAPNQQVCHAQA